MTDETTPDAVERYEPDQKYIGSGEYVVEMFPDPNGEWVRHTTLLTERQRHAEEVAALRAQLRRVEGERDRMQRANETLAVRMDLPASQLLMVGSELCGDGKIDPNDHRDPRWTPSLQQAAKVMRELTTLRSLLPDVRACAEWMRDELIEGHELQALGCRILAVLDSQGGEGE